MREIKFRAWDKVNDKMLYWEELLNFDFEVGESYPTDFPINELKDDNKFGWKWMQFTGLHDKNGKEIYEGDIVSVKYMNEEEIHEVKWFGDTGYPAFDFEWWEGEENGLSAASQSSDIEIEVIGNIYENPELLNQ